MARTSTFTRNSDLAALVARFGSEDKCRAYLEQLRWPDGVRCPRCDASKGISRIETRGQFECDSCGYQFSVRAGTLLHDSHLPLWKWFLAVYVIGESKNGVSANQLKQILGVSYKTAWYLSHRIRAAMKGEAPELLRGMAKSRGKKAGGAGMKGSILAGEEQGVRDVVKRGSRVRLRLRKRSTKEAPRARATDANMETIESVWALFEQSVVGSYHHLSAKHLPAYLDETAFRYNNRENAYLFRDLLLRLIGAESVPYTELIHGD